MFKKSGVGGCLKKLRTQEEQKEVDPEGEENMAGVRRVFIRKIWRVARTALLFLFVCCLKVNFFFTRGMLVVFEPTFARSVCSVQFVQSCIDFDWRNAVATILI